MADCARCGGACCESITLDLAAGSNDFQTFIELRSLPQIKPDGSIARNFSVACYALVAGRCAIYDHRPQICRLFEPGGAQCRSTVQARRALDEALAILGAEPVSA